MQNLKKTYNSGYSLVVTDPTTNPPITGLTRGERTGSRAFQYLWPYVLYEGRNKFYIGLLYVHCTAAVATLVVYEARA